MADYAQIAVPETGKPRADRILRQVDGATIPADPGNADWVQFQAWLAAGNVPDPAPAWAPPARQALGSALRDALKARGWSAAWQTSLSGQSQDTRDWWTAHYSDLIPITATKLVRIAGACSPSVDLPSLFTAADA